MVINKIYGVRHWIWQCDPLILFFNEANKILKLHPKSFSIIDNSLILLSTEGDALLGIATPLIWILWSY